MNFNKSIRNKRFRAKQKSTATVHFRLDDGSSYVAQIVDCSVSGMRLMVESALSLVAEVGEIVSETKIVKSESEFGLGRTVLRRIDESRKLISIQTIDSSVPINTFLAQDLDISLENDDWFKDYELGSEKFNLSHFVEGTYESPDIFEKFGHFSIFLNEWVKSNKYAYNSVRTESKGNRVNLRRSRKQGRNDYIIMGSNDYLGLSTHPEVIDAAKSALDVYGFGSTGSHVTTGITDIHSRLCDKLASMHGREAAILFNSGYAANIGIISSVCQAQDLIIADHLCHASIHDGIQMSRASKRLFRHNDYSHLESILKKERENYKGCLLITEGVFSMDGDSPDLQKLYRLARDYNCRIMVDQAHDFGVVGPSGLGICDKYSLLKQVDIIMGTFSKIGGGIGGFVVGDQKLIDWLHHFSRAHIFSVSIPPSTAAAALKALEIFERDKTLLQKLKGNIAHFKAGLASIGYNLPKDHESSVIPVIIGNEKKLGTMYESMMNDGIYCVPIVYPAVSRTNCRFRFTIMATHSHSDLDLALTVLEKAMLKADFQFEQIHDDQIKKSA